MFFDAFAALDDILKLQAASCDNCDNRDKPASNDRLSQPSRLSQRDTLQTDKAALPRTASHGPAKSAPTGSASNAQDRILAAIREGNKTPGAIATATRLGGTATYQQLDRMVLAEALTMARDGTYCPAPTATET